MFVYFLETLYNVILFIYFPAGIFLQVKNEVSQQWVKSVQSLQ